MAAKGERQTIDAVYETELEHFLADAGLQEVFHRGELLCITCGTVVTRENLFGFVANEGSLGVVCDRAECVEAVYGLHQSVPSADVDPPEGI